MISSGDCEASQQVEAHGRGSQEFHGLPGSPLAPKWTIRIKGDADGFLGGSRLGATDALDRARTDAFNQIRSCIRVSRDACCDSRVFIRARHDQSVLHRTTRSDQPEPAGSGRRQGPRHHLWFDFDHGEIGASCQIRQRSPLFPVANIANRYSEAFRKCGL